MKNQSLNTLSIYYGLGIGFILNLFVILFLKDEKIYTGDDLITLFSIGIIILGFIFLFKTQSERNPTRIPSIRQFIGIIILYSIIISVCMGLGHYINATYIDPDWGQKSLEIAQQKWAEKNYSPDAIESQIEWTDTFQNPIKWSLILFVFFTILLSFIGGIIALIFYVKHHLTRTIKTT